MYHQPTPPFSSKRLTALMHCMHMHCFTSTTLSCHISLSACSAHSSAAADRDDRHWRAPNLNYYQFPSFSLLQFDANMTKKSLPHVFYDAFLFFSFANAASPLHSPPSAQLSLTNVNASVAAVHNITVPHTSAGPP